MSTLTLTPTSMQEGIWRGFIHQSGQGVPQLIVTHQDKPVENVDLTEVDGDASAWEVAIPVPIEAVADGMQTIVIADRLDGEVLGHFSLLGGEAVGEDLRAEVTLLRAELDMLKQAFRRHCRET